MLKQLIGRRLEVLSVLVVLAALVLGCTYFSNVLLLQDGGWYTYPSYAVLMGGDPSENIPGYVIQNAHPGVTVKFIWENRTNLFVWHQWLGLSALGTTWADIRIYGGLQWLMLAGLAACIVGGLTRALAPAMVMGALVLADSVLIGASLSNARPDVIHALIALALFGTLEWMSRSGSFLPFFLALVLAATLSLMHVTAAIAIALLGFYIAAFIWTRWRSGQLFGMIDAYFVVVGLVLCLTYLVRADILNVLVPTHVSASIEREGQHSLLAKLRGNFGDGAYAKFLMEQARWQGYFVIKNLTHLILLIVGGGILLLPVRPAAQVSILARRMGLAVVGATVFQLMTDPHGTPAHLIVIMVFAYMAVVLRLWEWMQETPGRMLWVTNFVSILLVATAVMKVGQSYKIHQAYAGIGFTNHDVEVSLDNLLKTVDPAADITLRGPAELWPYLPMSRPGHLTILDFDRTKVARSVDEAFRDGVSFLVINEDYWGSGWAPVIREWLQQGQIQPVANFGDCGQTVACLAIYRRVGS